ncbi:ATP-dependent nuclease [Acinetobacter baumannii]|uniref:ATP-dependent nuclease n=3 Tax=Acinetobacter baumannii TaxID=470 RepID=UPI002277F5CB|nr:ATP-binding protein [Acinetobacter baumannii]EKV2801120.1 ATP-binding protein [Acinetobacter baumannii]MCY3369216.1 ATP-binding protein [Acinetobacter baumannii]MDC4573880.1 ATP-binding protein [Acinetobacter baumannii]MDV7586211.1 ATP-binding protein [Acinetobacter baumannii]MDV7593063.1 ATP-binding protein [Acinetobacter baumannii]
MNYKLYYWADDLNFYFSDNHIASEQAIEIKRLNFFIGKNNAGKSRFLRTLYASNKNIRDNNFYDATSEISTLKELVENESNSIWMGNGSSSSYRADLLNYINDILETKVFPRVRYKDYFLKNFEKIKLYRIKDKEIFTTITQQISTKIEENDLLIANDSGKKYIPILRGMRPVINEKNKLPYLERTQKDYFNNQHEYSSTNIITGELLYEDLKIHLLGEPEQRDLIKDYEEKLSQYFFDNEPVSLIPKHDQDVVNIKIGKDKQFPISQLGDGLQQAIILTYEAFTKKDEIYSFFIEEPELHMHAGMVRQLMNFYLNETNHYYFFTTHSNHLLDMADESDQVIIQKFVKQPKSENPKEFEFKIYRCDRDRDLLASLGVKPSSVYLANCTIWVEGITDRLYITKYMEKYLSELENSDLEQYKKYRRFMPNYHYTFVEYAGSNLTHWSFSDDYADHLEDKGLSAKAVASEMLLIADGDIQGKADRVRILKSELNKENYYILECKETENTLPKSSIVRVAKVRFPRMKPETKKSYDISLIDSITDENYFDHANYGIGKLIDSKIKKPSSTTKKTAFADGNGVGTIKYKLDFCREIIKDFDENPDWQLTPKAKALCERIFKHIEKCNQ